MLESLKHNLYITESVKATAETRQQGHMGVRTKTCLNLNLLLTSTKEMQNDVCVDNDSHRLACERCTNQKRVVGSKVVVWLHFNVDIQCKENGNKDI